MVMQPFQQPRLAWLASCWGAGPALDQVGATSEIGGMGSGWLCPPGVAPLLALGSVYGETEEERVLAATGSEARKGFVGRSNTWDWAGWLACLFNF